MPPKVETVTETFVFEKDRMIKKFQEDNYNMRQKVQAIHVPQRPNKDPAEKLKERINTYKNVRKMKTDYKNYVTRYGTPSFYVPEELWRN